MFEPDYFKRKREQLGLDREDVIVQVQRTLDSWYPGATRVRRLHQGVLSIITPSAGVASELRMRQRELFELHTLSDTRLAISISTLR